MAACGVYIPAIPPDVVSRGSCGPRYLKRSSLPNRAPVTRGFTLLAFALYRPGPGFGNGGRSGLLNAPGGGIHLPLGLALVELASACAYGESRSCGADDDEAIGIEHDGTEGLEDGGPNV